MISKISHSPVHLGKGMLACVLSFVEKNTVMCIALLLAAVTSCIVPPDSGYLSYIDFGTLACLFSMLAVICALKNIRFFTFLAKRIIRVAPNTRRLVLSLVYVTFIGSMLIANDMALLTFLPLGYISLSCTGKQKYMALTFVFQNIAANLGGMLTPFGNPQNLYLYSKFSIPTGEFMSIMLLPFAVSVALITVCCLFIPREALTLEDDGVMALPKWRTVLYVVMFAVTVLTVFRVIPYAACAIGVTAVLLFADRAALGKVDYPLLITFAAFFVFAGNMSRIEAVNAMFSSLLDTSALLTSVVSCQVISNVPSAILLSQFTSNYRELLVGVNIGGVGTLISSLASLITFREYTSHYKEKTASYLALFSAFNFGFLILLTAIMMFVFR